MDDMTDFEWQLSAEFSELMGPVGPVDDAAIFEAITASQPPKWRMQSMFSATRFVVAGAVVALFGAFLLAGMPSQPRADDLVPGASILASDPPGLIYMLDGDIYMAEEDGTDPVRIVDGDADAECGGPRDNRGLVSPDGRHIAYRSGWPDGCPETVSIADLDGRRVALVPGAGWDIAWAPDGSRFASWLSFGESIGVYGIDGSLQAELDGSVACCGDHDPRWTPDGTALLVPADPTTGTYQALVARLPLDGGEPEILPATDPMSIRSVSFSPDGDRVAYVGPDSQLVVAALDGTPPGFEFHFEPGDEVDARWARRPLWAPNGDRIAVVTRSVSTDAAGDQIQQSADLWVADPTTGESTMVDTVFGNGYLQPITFSPDGDRILVKKVDPDGAPGLWTVASDGSGSTVLVAGADHGEWVPPHTLPG